MKITRLSAKQNSGEQLMRPGQQNKRGRGRGSNNNNNNNNGGGNNNFNRKGGNPLTRTYDSSGPDVKIRGTAQHIAEKYAALARDAQSSGDRVIAENYLQHAEHYNRIIATAQAQMQERFQRDDRGEYNAADADADDMDGNDGDDGVVASQQHSEQVERVQQPERQERTERSEPRQERRERPDRRERQERQPRQPQVSAEQPPPVYDASQAPQPVIEGTPMEVAVEEEQQQAEAPATERAPKTRRATTPRPRRPRRAAAAEGAEGEDAPAGEDATSATLENAAE